MNIITCVFDWNWLVIDYILVLVGVAKYVSKVIVPNYTFINNVTM